MISLETWCSFLTTRDEVPVVQAFTLYRHYPLENLLEDNVCTKSKNCNSYYEVCSVFRFFENFPKDVGRKFSFVFCNKKIFLLGNKENFPTYRKYRMGRALTVGSCENGIGDSIPILILGNHRFQNFWKGTHVKIESE